MVVLLCGATFYSCVEAVARHLIFFPPPVKFTLGAFNTLMAPSVPGGCAPEGHFNQTDIVFRFRYYYWFFGGHVFLGITVPSFYFFEYVCRRGDTPTKHKLFFIPHFLPPVSACFPAMRDRPTITPLPLTFQPKAGVPPPFFSGRAAKLTAAPFFLILPEDAIIVRWPWRPCLRPKALRGECCAFFFFSFSLCFPFFFSCRGVALPVRFASSLATPPIPDVFLFCWWKKRRSISFYFSSVILGSRPLPALCFK